MSARIGAALTLDLISSAGACARTLRASYGNTSGPSTEYRDKQQVNLNLSMGACYCLEQQYSHVALTEFGSIAFDALPAFSNDFRIKWMASQVEYANFCSKMSEKQGKENDSHAVAQELEADLRLWKSSLPVPYHDIDKPYPCNIASDSRKLWLFCQYHEASLQIHMSHRERPDTGLSGDFDRGLQSARNILEVTSLLTPSIIASNR